MKNINENYFVVLIMLLNEYGMCAFVLLAVHRQLDVLIVIAAAVVVVVVVFTLSIGRMYARFSADCTVSLAKFTIKEIKHQFGQLGSSIGFNLTDFFVIQQNNN